MDNFPILERFCFCTGIRTGSLIVAWSFVFSGKLCLLLHYFWLEIFRSYPEIEWAFRIPFVIDGLSIVVAYFLVYGVLTENRHWIRFFLLAKAILVLADIGVLLIYAIGLTDDSAQMYIVTFAIVDAILLRKYTHTNWV